MTAADLEDLEKLGRARNPRSKTHCERSDTAEMW